MKTEVVFILDKSGSMSGLESDTIGGYNAMLKSQKQLNSDAFVTTVLFDDAYEMIQKHTPILEVKPLDEDTYCVRGTTALYDAIGKTIANMKKVSKDSKVIFIITTDGAENASKEYSLSQINRMITNKQEQGWEFIFLGANIDSNQQAKDLGLKDNRSINYRADSKGVKASFHRISDLVTNYRCTSEIDAQLIEDIE